MKNRAGIALFLFVAGFLALPAGAAEPVEFSQVLDLVAAGVGDGIILKQVAAGGPGFKVAISEVLSLKNAGASDDLIEGLMEMAEVEGSGPVPAAGSGDPGEIDDGEPSFRIFRETGEDGRGVVHITNLDAAGRRIGGPAPESEVVRSNAYLSRDEEPHPYDGHLQAGEGGGPYGGIPPVVVNVFVPDNEPVAIREAGHDAYARRYFAGYLPGVHGRRGYGLGRGYAFGVPSPPGSYSHYKRYHSGESGSHGGLHRGGPVVRHGYALPVPFHSAGASQLNRMRANVRLGH